VIGPHSCVTVESLLISLSIGVYYVGSKKTAIFDPTWMIDLVHISFVTFCSSRCLGSPAVSFHVITNSVELLERKVAAPV
jgi:hypothetical protein